MAVSVRRSPVREIPTPKRARTETFDQREMNLGNLYIVAAPSGAGKTSLVRALLAADSDVKLSISCTTRKPRPGEVDGREYHFLTVTEFEAMRAHGAFLESAQVHGNLYGTSREWVAGRLAAGEDLLLEIDWQGAAQVRRLMPEAIGVFVLPPSPTVLEERLRSRASDSDEVIARRLAVAREEIAHLAEFDYVIINDEFEQAARDLVSIVRAVRLRLDRQMRRHSDLLRQFE
jgi:guanylate kinase